MQWNAIGGHPESLPVVPQEAERVTNFGHYARHYAWSCLQTYSLLSKSALCMWLPAKTEHLAAPWA